MIRALLRISGPVRHPPSRVALAALFDQVLQGRLGDLTGSRAFLP